MGENSQIEWTNHTFNPVIGCTKVSDGCKFCYAETMMDKRYGKAKWGPGQTRVRTSAANWREPYRWNKRAETQGRRARVFCASLSEDHSDWIGPRGDLFAMIAETPWLDWLLLTKRPDGWADRLHEVVQNNHDGGDMLASQWLDGDAPANVWIGTSVENQAAADERIPHLLNIPAKVRFLSMEPLLGPVNLTGFASPLWGRLPANQFISWVIVGGESGHNARPVHPGWVRSLRDQCQGAGVPFFFKQWGEWLDQDCMTAAQYEIAAVLDPESIGGVRRYKRDGFLFPTHDSLVFRIGKKNAGRLLDGVEWGQFPGAL